MSELSTTTDTDRRLLVGFFATADRAQSTLKKLIDEDFPLDRVSLLGRAGASGDDPLGVYYSDRGERVLGWGKLGAIWGSLLGILGGAVGMFVIPGIGPMLIAGPLAEVLVGGVVGAGLGGGLMAGGAVLTELAVAIHRMGVPEAEIDVMEKRLRENQTMLLLIVDAADETRWRHLLDTGGAEHLSAHPYIGVSDALTSLVKG